MAAGGHITLQEAADRLGVHYMTAYRYVRTGRLPATRDGVEWRVDPDDLRRMQDGPRRTARGTGRARARARLVDRMVAGDEAGAWRVVEDALASGVEPRDVHLELLVPALRSIGEGWERGELTVAEEHRAAAVAQRLIGRLGPRFARRGRKRGAVVLGAAPGEEHGLPSAILADLLRGAGFEVVDLGADTPAESFAETAAGTARLVAVAIGVTIPAHAGAAAAAVRAVRSAGVGAPVLLGGAAIDGEEHALGLGADGWTGHDARTAVATIEDRAAARR